MSYPGNAASGLEASPLTLPFARKPEGNDRVAPASLEVSSDAAILNQLSAVSPDIDSVLLAAWATLLWRFSEQSDVVIGCLRDNRTEVLPVTVSFSPDLPFAGVVQQVQQAISREGDPQNYLHANGTGQWPAGFLLEDGSGVAKGPSVPSMRFQVVLRVHRIELSRQVRLLYAPASFHGETASRMARSYATLLAGLAAEPHAAADALPLLSPQDYEQVVVKFNQSSVAYPDKCVHELFEDQVRETPKNPALRFHEQTFTYQELNARANQIAHRLRKLGVGPSVPVALFVERSPEMIVGLLAILKAGGCYVPLVHDDPQARLAFLLADTKPPVLLTTRKLVPRLPAYAGEVVLADDSFDAEPAADPENETKTTDLVCIIYTSGSTGVPKGVAARHANLANYIQFIRQRLGRPQGWHFATVSTISAILGNTSVFGALMSGGCLHVIDYETAMAPNLFADYVAANPIDVMKIAPSQLSSLLHGAEGRPIVPRKYVVIGGEKFSWELLDQIRQNGACQVMNHYGPTETMGCCTFVVDGYDFSEWKPATVPLGRPMSNQQLYIVDRHLRPVPVGVPGELCMSGAGLTEGYFNQPQQTAEKFVPNPFFKDPSARLYRTGDLARFLPDGNIEFLGRIDHQVKIRGFRVEPAEVEAVLQRHPDIKQSVVVPEDGPSGEKLLAAYVVSNRILELPAVRSFLREELPEYLVPSRMLMLESLPLNRNGKVDLPALAALQAEDEGAQRAIVDAHNAIEEQLVAIWREVLNQERIGINDNFFELGGHSLLATQVISRIRNVFGVQFPIIDFLLSPTIAELAEKISQFPTSGVEDDETERLLREVESMSDEEAASQLPAEAEADGKIGGRSE